ncbi:MAG: hypothetical protein WEB60_08245 [Terrimicrobiaceae bacterium]
MKKKIATTEIHNKRARLKEMAERGTEHEAKVALSKLKALENLFDFSGPDKETTPNLFDGVHLKREGPSRSMRIISVEPAELEIGSYVKWAFLDRFRADSTWKKTKSGKTELHMNVDSSSAGQLRRVGDHIQKSFRAIWGEFSQGGTINTGQRAPFLSGVYDGMMGGGRPEGVRVPSALGGSPSKKRRAGKPSKKQSDPVVGMHPYELGLALGEKIAMKVPPKSLPGELQKLMAA